MKSSAHRKERRRKVVEMTFLLLRTENDRGMLAKDISTLIGKAHRFRMSVHRLGQIMRPYLADGTIEKETNIDGNSVWRLAYEPKQETN